MISTITLIYFVICIINLFTDNNKNVWILGLLWLTVPPLLVFEGINYILIEYFTQSIYFVIVSSFYISTDKSKYYLCLLLSFLSLINCFVYLYPTITETLFYIFYTVSDRFYYETFLLLPINFKSQTLKQNIISVSKISLIILSYFLV